MTKIDIGFLGYGRMAQAISEGLDRTKRMPYSSQAASDIAAQQLAALAAQRNIKAADDNQQVVDLAPVVVVAVKPHQVKEALSKIKETISSNPKAYQEKLFISIAAGVRLSVLAECLGPKVHLVRVIPNLPALVGQGMTLLCAPPQTPQEHIETAKSVFEAVGSVMVLDESKFDVGTAVSGSGPAYFFLVMEAMIRGAVRLGITWDDARELVFKVALGSALTALARPDLALADLRDQVTSPGGSTAEALYELENGSLTALFHKALQAASEKNSKLA
ncbi:MAG: pyrroline-5-carboxylate reductase [Deltaproteobacteria bacterium]|jgi:pyrroline-5-carboxylate reductase|nr:pyrroline-5-carboxylate reductase [Deltaproteobacteria bacterium]